MKKFNLAICQMSVSTDKKANIKKAVSMIGEAAELGAQMVVLPEMFNCPYDNSCFPIYAEDETNGETINAMSNTAKENGLLIVAGSLPEREEDKIFNTSFVFNNRGNIIAKHRKIHLFDIEIEGKIKFRESDILSAGSDITVVDTEYGRVGIAICYDIRFPELARLMALKGAELIVLPAAFNTTTGPAHWELLARSRAVDNQIYMVAASPARNKNASYVAYGHSMVVNPWGDIVSMAGEKEEILVSEIDLDKIELIRNQLPVLKNRRTDIYSLNEI